MENKSKKNMTNHFPTLSPYIYTIRKTFESLFTVHIITKPFIQTYYNKTRKCEVTLYYYPTNYKLDFINNQKKAVELNAVRLIARNITVHSVHCTYPKFLTNKTQFREPRAS